MDKPYLELVRNIRDAVREKAQEIPAFKNGGNGAIRITAYPCCKEADDWMGGLGKFVVKNEEVDDWLVGLGLDGLTSDKFGRDDIVDYEHTFAITEGGSRIVTYNSGITTQKVDCYAFSAMKIAHCSLVQDAGAGLISGIDLYDPCLTETNGYGPYLGALCIEIQKAGAVDESGGTPPWDIKDFCGIYVCVSGAESRDDLICASVAIDVIKKFFDNEKEYFGIYAPTVSFETE